MYIFVVTSIASLPIQYEPENTVQWLFTRMSQELSDRGFHKPVVKALDEQGREVPYSDLISYHQSLLLLTETEIQNLPPVAKSFLIPQAYNKMDPFGEDVFDDFDFNPNDFALTIIRKKSESARPFIITVLNSVNHMDISFEKQSTVGWLLEKLNTELDSFFVQILTPFNEILDPSSLLKNIYLDHHSVLAITEPEISKLPRISEGFFAYNVLADLKKLGRFPTKATENPFGEDVFQDFEFDDSDFNLKNIRKQVHVITTKGMIKVEYLAKHTIEWLLLESTLLLKEKGLDEALIRAMAEDGTILENTDLITYPALLLLTANETVILPKVSEAFFLPDTVEELKERGFYGRKVLFNMQNNPFGEDVFNDFDFDENDFSLTVIRKPKRQLPKVTVTPSKDEPMLKRKTSSRKRIVKTAEIDGLVAQLKSKFSSEETLFQDSDAETPLSRGTTIRTRGNTIINKPREANGIYDEDGFLIGRKYVPPQKNKQNDKLIAELQKVLKERNRKLAFRFAKAGLDFDHLII